MTKAEKIFKDTFYACMNHIKTWGYDVDKNGKAIGFNRLNTEEVTCTRTFNAVQKFINNRRKDSEIAKRLGIADPEWDELVGQALNMTQSTLDNAIETERKFQEMLRA